MRQLAERGWFLACLGLGLLLRASRYSRVQLGHREGIPEVRKRRSFHAPLLVWLSIPLIELLDAGVTVLPQRDWEEREQQLYQQLYGSVVRVEHGTLVLPFLPGETLAAVLENRLMDASRRTRAIQLALAALSDFHRSGFTHGDAMAENVMVDLEAGVARWFDFETVHDPRRPEPWRRADDLRALLATCLLRTEPAHFEATIREFIAGSDQETMRTLAASFISPHRRALPFHLGQAPLSLQTFREIGPLLDRLARTSASSASV